MSQLVLSVTEALILGNIVVSPLIHVSKQKSQT